MNKPRHSQLGRRHVLLLCLGLASVAAVAGAQPPDTPGDTLVCTPVEEGGEEGLYRCAPATVSDGKIMAIREPTTLSLLRREIEALRLQVAELCAAVPGCQDSGVPRPADIEETEASVQPDELEGEPQPTNDLLWRTERQETPTHLPEHPHPPSEHPHPPSGHPHPASEHRHPAPERRFSLLDFNVGAEDGNATAALTGRYFSRFRDHLAVQAQGSFLYYDERREIELDLGLVNRIGDFQLGLFGGVKHLGFRDFEDAATLAQASMTADWVFPRGRLGFFGAAGVRDRDVVDRRLLRRNFELVTFVEVVDQIGISGQFRPSGKAYFEGNAAYLIAADSRRETGGLLRFVYPVGERGWALTAEGSWNDTLVSSPSDDTRFAIGIRTGAWLWPWDQVEDRTTETSDSEGGTEKSAGAVPVEIPQIRYEVRTRERRLGNDFPVADAGPDQLVPADCSTAFCSVTVTLDGSGSFDPDGDPITYSWTPRSGFDDGEVIESADQVVASFAAHEGRRYVMRLTVSDGERSGSDEVVVTVQQRPEVKIVRLAASPKRIGPGEGALLEWKVKHATRVTLTAGPDGSPQPVALDLGALPVTPAETTVYTLEASNEISRDRRSVTVTVKATPPPRIIEFWPRPMVIAPGESAALWWRVEGATSVTIAPDIGVVAPSGSRVVSPLETTSYTLSAENEDGVIVSRTATLTVKDD